MGKQRAHREQLVESELSMEDVPPGQPVVTFEIERA
jgi:hypothetical protein